ncbi:MAG: ScpA family protein [Pseudomonadota bacterium]
MEEQHSDANDISDTDEDDELTAFAKVLGEPVTELPKDLYIPPDALEVFLETFEGPLDLLLYLIRKQNLDILDIPIARITAQYLQYINLMRELQLDLAAEYLVMAALLMEIKSRMLLTQPKDDDENTDPRRHLVQQLEEYARYKQAAQDLSELPQMGRDTWQAEAWMPEVKQVKKPPRVKLDALIAAMEDVLIRAELHSAHHITREPLSVRERMTIVLDALNQSDFVMLEELFTIEEGRAGVVVCLLAILELSRESVLQINQPDAYGAIRVSKLTPSQ